MDRTLDTALRAWLESGGGDLLAGFDPTGWERSIWLLHPIYEAPMLPSGLSHDDVRRIEDAAGVGRPEVAGGIDGVVAEIACRPDTTLRGGGPAGPHILGTGGSECAGAKSPHA